jgi:serine/threonine-protein kinase
MKYIGRYRILGLLGRGGMSKVYKVSLPVIDKTAALKVLDPNPMLLSVMGMDKIIHLFTAEAKILANLRHPNIIDIWGFESNGGKPYYLMDYYCLNIGDIIGETYRTEKPTRIIRIDKAVYYIRQTLMGLARLHHAGIIHRDIKPFNLMLTDHETVKICDFGLSKLRGEPFHHASSLKVGSPYYAAPEQEISANQADVPADLYSTGVVLYRMLTGQLPSRSSTSTSVINPDTDHQWDAFFDKILSPHPGQRFGTASEMLAALDECYTAWQAKTDGICNWLESNAPLHDTPAKGKPLNVRKKAVKISPRQARSLFGTDPLWRPEKYHAGDFQSGASGVILDKTTRLAWQKSGSEYPLTWPQAKAYIQDLNREQFGGRGNWRLPTVNELMSLVTRTPHGGDYCADPVFDPYPKRLWSCDRRSFIAAWYVNLEMGYVAWHDFNGYFYTKAVRSIEQADNSTLV